MEGNVAQTGGAGDVIAPPVAPEALYSYQLANGEIVTANSAERVKEVCPYIAQLAIEAPDQADLILALAASGTEMIQARESRRDDPVREPKAPEPHSTKIEPTPDRIWAPRVEETGLSEVKAYAYEHAVQEALRAREIIVASDDVMESGDLLAGAEKAEERVVTSSTRGSVKTRKRVSGEGGIAPVKPASGRKPIIAASPAATSLPVVPRKKPLRQASALPAVKPVPVARPVTESKGVVVPTIPDDKPPELIPETSAITLGNTLLEDKSVEAHQEAPAFLVVEPLTRELAEPVVDDDIMEVYHLFIERASIPLEEPATVVSLDDAPELPELIVFTDDFEAFVELQPTGTEHITIETIIEHAQTEQPLEQTLVALARFLSEPITRESTQGEGGIPEALSELEEALAASYEEAAMHLTPDVVEKLFVLLGRLGYERPKEVLTHFAKNHDADFLLHAVGYLCQLNKNGERQEITEDPVFSMATDDSALPQLSKILRGLILRHALA